MRPHYQFDRGLGKVDWDTDYVTPCATLGTTEGSASQTNV